MYQTTTSYHHTSTISISICWWNHATKSLSYSPISCTLLFFPLPLLLRSTVVSQLVLFQSQNCWYRNYYFIPFVIIILPSKTRRSSFSLDLLIYNNSESIIILPVKLPCLLVLFFFTPLLIMVVLYIANKLVYSSLRTSFWSFYYFTFCLRRESLNHACLHLSLTVYQPLLDHH